MIWLLWREIRYFLEKGDIITMIELAREKELNSWRERIRCMKRWNRKRE